jgi:hypothetical protein
MIQDTTYLQVDASDPVAAFNALVGAMQANPELAAEVMGPKQGNPVTLGSPVIPADEWADKQVRNASNASATWLKNVKRPRRNPLEAAIAAAPKRENKVKEALAQKKWEKAMAKVDENVMYATIDKRGESAFRAGIEDRKDKVLARVRELQPLVTAVATTIQSMPDATDADREKRLLAARKLMIEVGKKRLGVT